MRTFLPNLFWTFLVQTRLYRLVFTLGLVFYSFSGSATVYYVSTSGNDSNAGTSTSTAWKTLAKVNSFNARPGDKILFKKGEIWEGTLIPASSGSSGSPITYGSYGTGEKPKIYASKNITGWTKHSGNIYKAEFNGNIEQLFINGDRQKLARYPNEGYFNISKVKSSTNFTCTSLSGGINYKGASWIGRTSAFTLFSKKVTSSSSQSITIDKSPTYGLGAGKGFFLANKLEFLDQAGEWYYDSSSNTVYLWTPTGSSPANFTVRGSTFDYGVNISGKNYVIITDLEILQSGIDGIYIYNSDYITIENNRIISPDLVGIHLPSGNASSPKLTNNYIYEANANAIRCYSVKATITDNIIENTGLFNNINKSTLEKDNFGTAIFSRSDNPRIEYNRIINTGYAGINWKGKNGSIKYNFINHACVTIDDAGGIYTYNNPSDYSRAGSAGSEVMYNIILNVHGNRVGYTGTYDAGSGIYMDDLTHDVDIKYNTISGCNSGVFLHVAGRINVQYNQISDCMIGVLAGRQEESSYVYDNIVYAFDRPGDASWWKDSHQRMVKNDAASPKYNRNQYIHHYASDDQFSNSYSFSQWKSASKQDANSTFDGSKLADESIEELFYNDTKQSKSINLGNTVYTDINGKRISGTITLKPFTSIILIRKMAENESSNSSPLIQNQSFELQGSQQKNNFVGKVIATDPDKGQQLNYSIIQGNEANLFSIHSTTGEILVNNTISAISNNSFSLVVKVIDNGVNALSANAVITVNVLKEETSPIIDITTPTISSFTIPSSTSSLTIPISSFNASDNNGVIGYLIKESSGTPNANDNGWTASAPNSFTVSETGNKTLYAWVKDAAGNISDQVQAQVSITLPDSSIPEDEIEYVAICEGDEYFGLTKSGEYKRTISPNQNSENLITNPDFINDITNWRTWSGGAEYNISLSLNKDEYFSAPASMRIYCSSNGTRNTNLHLISNGSFEITKGKEYELTFNVKGTSEFSLGSLIILKNTSPWTIYGTFSNESLVVTKDWKQVKVKFTATHTATDAMFRIYMGNCIPKGESMYVDDFYFREYNEQEKTITTNLTVNPTSHKTEDITINDGEEYQGWTTSGVYERILRSAIGCDSIVTTNLTVINLKSETLQNITEDIAICAGSSYQGWSETGEYDRLLKSISGADSIIVTTNLSVYPSYDTIETVTILKSENYLGWTETGLYERVLTSVSGCDSIVTTILDVIEEETDELNEAPLNYMYIGVTAAYIDGINLQAGDKIEVYDGANCVGSSLLKESIDSTNTNSYALIKIVKNNGNGIGFTEGNNISFKIWDSNKQEEKNIEIVRYKQNISTWNISGTFIGGSYSFVSICNPIKDSDSLLPPTETHSIILNEGWNIISTFLVPTDLSMDKVFEELCLNGQLIEVEDGLGNTYKNDVDNLGWTNNIGDIEKSEGYKVRVNSKCILEISGQPINLPMDFELRKGWNIISLPYNSTISAMEFIQPLIDAGILEKVQDEMGNSIEYWESIGWVDGIGSFEVGEGYKVLVNNAGYLPIKSEYEKSVSSSQEIEETSNFKANYPGNGLDHMNINISELKETLLQVGDEIAAFDGETCVGAITLTEGHFRNNTVSINASFSNEELASGFIEMNSIELRIWNSESDAELQLQPNILLGNMIFQRQSSVFLELNNQNAITNSEFDSLSISTYPNPTNEQVTIRFSQLPEAGTNIELWDTAGKQLIKQEVQTTQETLDIHSYPNGIYLVKTISEENRTVSKLIKK